MNKYPSNWVAPFELNELSFLDLSYVPSQSQVINLQQDKALTVQKLLQDPEVDNLQNKLQEIIWQPVGLDGILSNYNEGDTVGSYRATTYNEELAEVLFQRIKNYLSLFEDKFVKPLTVNPLFRFIHYKDGGLLVPHYDAPYEYPDHKRITQVSVVIYLTNSEKGKTRFLKDPQINKTEKDYSDWTFLAKEEDIFTSVPSQKGSSLLFPHRVLHDSEPLLDEEKTIIRSDIIYEI